jgi:hypothetical protein
MEPASGTRLKANKMGWRATARRILSLETGTAAVLLSCLIAAVGLAATAPVAAGQSVPAASGVACADFQLVCSASGTNTSVGQTLNWYTGLNNTGTVAGTEQGSASVNYAGGTGTLMVQDSVNGYIPYIDAPGGFCAPAAAICGQSFSNLLFYYEVSGPPGAIVPIDVSALASAVANGDPYSIGTVSILVEDLSGNTLLYSVACSGGTSIQGLTCPGALPEGVTAGFSVNSVIDAEAGFDYDVSLSAECETYSDITPSSCNASMDPMFQIDPSFAAANPGYTLMFSPDFAGSNGGGGGGTSTTPEPGTLALFGSGLLVAAGVLRRKLEATRRPKRL